MNKIDTSNWKEFHLYDIFDISMGNKFDKSKMSNFNPKVNFVGRSSLNNGVSTKVDFVIVNNKTVEPYPAGDITIAMGGSIGSTFVQKEDFYTSQNVCVLHTDHELINTKVKMFIATCIMASCNNYEAFVEELNKHIRTDFIIYLPVDEKQNPDWQYMESYISELESRVSNSLENLESAKNAKDSRLSITSWKEFALKDIFKDYIKPMVLHSREVKENDDGIPYVVRTKFNNGIKCRVAKESKMKPSPSGVISWGAENASFFYQDEEWVSGRDIYYIDTRERTRNECLFIISCLRQIGRKYPYNYGLFPDLLKEEMISLPVKDNGEIDWEYMNDYIDNINSISEQKLEALS